MHFKAKSRFWT